MTRGRIGSAAEKFASEDRKRSTGKGRALTTMNLRTSPVSIPISDFSSQRVEKERERRNNAPALSACQAIRNSSQCSPLLCTSFCPDSRRKAWISELRTSR